MALVFEPGCYGLVLEYAEHGDIFDYVEEHDPSWKQKLSLIHGTACGLSYLHSLKPPVIHGDLKTQNILVCENLIPKICDFGFAQLKEWSKSHSSEVVRRGTVSPTHIPPETWKDSYLRKNEKFDVYGIGICLWEIITARKPFEGMRTEVIKVAVMDKQRPDLEQIRELTSSENITELVKQCWDEDATKRPTANEIKLALEAEMETTEMRGFEINGWNNGNSRRKPLLVYYLFDC